jgi:hypothetical protein
MKSIEIFNYTHKLTHILIGLYHHSKFVGFWGDVYFASADAEAETKDSHNYYQVGNLNCGFCLW